METIKIVVCSGGTGGHLFPAQAVVDSLLSFSNKKQLKDLPRSSVTFFTDKRTLTYLKGFNKEIQIKTIITLQFSGKGMFYKLKALAAMAAGVMQTIGYFITRRPNVVVAFGGYVSVPVLAAAVLLRIPIVLHEQNAILGRANRLFARFAKVIATSFSATLGLEKYLAKVCCTGLPLRKEILAAVDLPVINEREHSSNAFTINLFCTNNTTNNNTNLNNKLNNKHYSKVINNNIVAPSNNDNLIKTNLPTSKSNTVESDDIETINLPKSKYTLAILGGSQGAKIFGVFIPQSLARLPQEWQQKLTVFHQCRQEVLQETTAAWQKTAIKVILKPFFRNIAEVLQQSDLIITRSGAATIAEINCTGTIALYIPFKRAILNHQEYNARAMVNKGCATILLEEDLNFNNFNAIILNLLSDSEARNKMASKAKEECKANAAALLATLITKIAQNKDARF